MNNNLNNLRRRVMARIYFEFAKNIFLEYPNYFMLSVFIITALTSISVQDVFINAPKSNLSSAFNFFMVALRDTNWIIQALIVSFFIRVAIIGTKSAYKNVRSKWSLVKFRY